MNIAQEGERGSEARICKHRTVLAPQTQASVLRLHQEGVVALVFELTRGDPKVPVQDPLSEDARKKML